MTEAIAAFRRFNRFYSALLGLLDGRLYGSPATLGQARMLYEIAKRPGCRARDICLTLDMDRGQASRLLAGLVRRGLVRLADTGGDRRSRAHFLTTEGEGLLADLRRRAEEQAGDILGPLDEGSRRRLLSAMADIEAILGRVEPGE